MNKYELKLRVDNLLHAGNLFWKNEKNYSTLINEIPAGIALIDSKKIIYANPEMLRILGEEYDNVIDINYEKIIYDKDYEKLAEFYNEQMGDGKKSSNLIEIRLKNSEGIIWIELRLTEIFYQNRLVTLMICLDISKRKKDEKRLQYLSFHDRLTGLYNRAYFREEVKRLDTIRQLPLSIIMADVNGLKLTNDAFGHQLGDKVLIEISHVISENCREEDIISRWGGDEFAVLLPKTDEDGALKIIERIKKKCNKTKVGPIFLSIAMGLAVKTEPEEDIDCVIKEAEGYMYDNKLIESKSTNNKIISSLKQTLQEKNLDSSKQAERIKDQALKIGKMLNLNDRLLNQLSLLASLNDIGKVAFPEELFNKKKELTKKEREMIKKHSEVGYHIVKSIPKLASIAEGVLSHHERWDGTGYPRGLKGKEIPLISRIISLLDAYYVMIHKESLSKKETFDKIKENSGKQIDPDIVESFIKLIKY